MVVLWRAIQRWSAWLLFPLILLQFISGYAILHGRLFGAVLSKPAAFKLHGVIQPLTVAAFVVHGFPWLRRAVARHRIAGRWIGAALGIAGTGLIAFASYLAVRG